MEKVVVLEITNERVRKLLISKDNWEEDVLKRLGIEDNKVLSSDLYQCLDDKKVGYMFYHKNGTVSLTNDIHYPFRASDKAIFVQFNLIGDTNNVTIDDIENVNMDFIRKVFFDNDSKGFNVLTNRNVEDINVDEIIKKYNSQNGRFKMIIKYSFS